MFLKKNKTNPKTVWFFLSSFIEVSILLISIYGVSIMLIQLWELPVQVNPEDLKLLEAKLLEAKKKAATVIVPEIVSNTWPTHIKVIWWGAVVIGIAGVTIIVSSFRP